MRKITHYHAYLQSLVRTANLLRVQKVFSFWTFLFVILLSFQTFVVTLRKYNACLSYNLNSSLIWKRKWIY